MNWFQDFASDPYNPLNLLSGLFSHPVKFVQNPIAASKKTLEEGAAKTIANTVVNTAIASTALLTAGAALAPESAVGAAGSTLIKTAVDNPKTTAVVALAMPVVAGVVSKSPTKSLSAVANVPKKLTNFGSNLGGVIENPSVESVKTLVKENPVIAGGAALATVGVLGYGASNLISNVSNTLAVKENTKAMTSVPNTPTVITKEGGGNAPTVIQILPATPTTPPPSNVTPSLPVEKKKSTKKRKKKKVYKHKKTKKKSKSNKKRKKNATHR